MHTRLDRMAMAVLDGTNGGDAFVVAWAHGLWLVPDPLASPGLHGNIVVFDSRAAAERQQAQVWEAIARYVLHRELAVFDESAVDYLAERLAAKSPPLCNVVRLPVVTASASPR